MRLYIPFIGLEAETNENQAIEICIENPIYLSKICQDIYCQCCGECGEIAIYDTDKAILFSKNVAYIANPFDINCNDKKIITKLYQELNDIVNNRFIDKYNEVNTKTVCFLDELIEESPYSLSFNLEVEPAKIFKTYELKILQADGDICSVLADYLGLSSSVLGTRVVIFVNLKMYLSLEQCEEIYKFCYYNKINVINISGYMPYRTVSEIVYIIDKDLCIIEA